MNEFCAKKLGEVLAFEYLGKETFNRGKEALSKILSDEVLNKSIKSYEEFINEIEEVVKKNNSSEITFPKKSKTLSKLKEMQNLYIGEEWDNPIELSEWSGFYEGAAIVHWELVLGTALKLRDSVLEYLALKAIRFHSNSLDCFSDILLDNGIKKAE